MTRIISVASKESKSGTTVDVVGNGRIPEYITNTLDFPPRIVVDFCNAANCFKPKAISVESPNLKSIRLGYHEKRIRLVLDIKGTDIPAYTATSNNNSLSIFVKSREIVDAPEIQNKKDSVRKKEPEHKGESKEISGNQPGNGIRPLEKLLAIELDDGQDDTALFAKSVDAYRSQNWPSAVEGLTHLIETYPDGRYTERASFLLAKSYEHLYSGSLSGHFIELEGYYQDVVSRFPDSVYVPEALFAMGNLCSRVKNYYEAVAYYNMIGKNYKDSAVALPALINKAGVLRLKKKRREALSILQFVVDHYPGTPEETEAKIEISKILYEIKGFRKSLNILFELRAANSENIYRYPQISLYFGNNYYQLGDGVKARENLYRFYNSCPDEEMNHLVLTKIADTYRDEGLLGDAAKIYQLVLTRYPEKEGALISLIRLAEQQQEGELKIKRGITSPAVRIGTEIEAPAKIYEDVLNTILTKDEKNPLAQLALLRLATLYHKRKDYDKSLETLKRLLKNYPLTRLREQTKGALRKTLEDMLSKKMRTRDYTNIIDIYCKEKNLFLLVKSPDAFLTLARASAKLNLTSLATEMFGRADTLLTDEEKPADLLFCLGGDEFRKDKLNRALSRLNLLTEHYPHDKNAPLAYQLKGRILIKQKRYIPAVRIFSAALGYRLKACDRARILAERARALAELKRREEALKATQEADRAKGNCYIDYYNIYKEIGDLYLDLGSAREALAAFNGALEKEKKDENKILLKLKIAQCYRLLNQKKDCLSIYNEIVSLNDPFWSNLARENIEEINFESEFKKIRSNPPPPPPPAIKGTEQTAIKKLIATWQQAWQQKDLPGYMACYSDDFSCRGLTRTRWKRHRARINGRHTNIQVNLSNLTVEPLSDTKALVSFDQDYRADQYHDWGKKTMRLIKKGGTWKIQREAWLRAAEKKKG
ncbi:MAG: tetratricopeptide repeat protein [Deltaproteobacteria bacterium]|nr:tetratricopeptide repeat protein [Deltaproteobacteria bacterium]MBW2340085.1 tetratricopeptide repeat protein [Deltaproteobacteria bacterium]